MRDINKCVIFIRWIAISPHEMVTKEASISISKE